MTIAQVLDYKQRRLDANGLKPKCNRVTIAADFVKDNWEQRLIDNGR